MTSSFCATSCVCVNLFCSLISSDLTDHLWFVCMVCMRVLKRHGRPQHLFQGWANLWGLRPFISPSLTSLFLSLPFKAVGSGECWASTRSGHAKRFLVHFHLKISPKVTAKNCIIDLLVTTDARNILQHFSWGQVPHLAHACRCACLEMH